MSSPNVSAPAIPRCQSCGAEFPCDAAHCPGCGREVSSRSARITLAITLLLIFVGFAFTRYFVVLHRNTEASLAQRWFVRGNEAMQVNLPSGAAEAYRTALSYDPENTQYRLRLAEALLAANRLNEANAHLVSIWEDEPADGEVNLTLARLHVKRGDTAQAIHYYNNAINGVWDDNPHRRRIAARFELAQYLIGQHKLAEARAAMLAQQADAPRDLADQLLLAQLLFQVTEPEHAIDAYHEVLAADRTNAQAWLGLGQALLSFARYTEAERAFANAVEYDSKLTEAHQQLELVREVLRLDPALRGLPLEARTKRVAEAFTAALKRLSSCAAQQGYQLTEPAPAVAKSGAGKATTSNAPTGNVAVIPAPGNLQQLYDSGEQKAAGASEAALRKNPDALEPAMQYVFEVERATAAICPSTEITDRALLALAQNESESPR